MAAMDAARRPMGHGGRHGPSEGRPATPLLRWERRTALVGLAATAVAFGPARMAFGMLLPSISEAFALSAGAAGLIASAAFAGFAVALVITSLATRAVGAKLPVVVGGALAFAGATVVALAGSVATLTLGVVLATASAGLCWTPFNAVAARLVRAKRRDRVLSIVSTGTTLGVAAMGLGALALVWSGADWRIVWWATAAGGAAVAGLAYGLLPPTRRLRPRRPANGPDLAARDVAARLLERAAWPMYALAFVFGAISAVFATFAVDHVVREAARENALGVGGVVFLAYGTLGAAGFATAVIERRAGLRGALALSFTAAGGGTAVLSLAPQSWPLLVAGAGLVGASVMVFCALLAVASLRVFPALPVVGFTAGVLMMSLGSVIGPALAGVLADTHGIGIALLAAAAGAMLAGALSLALPVEGRHEDAR